MVSQAFASLPLFMEVASAMSLLSSLCIAEENLIMTPSVMRLYWITHALHCLAIIHYLDKFYESHWLQKITAY